MKPTRPADEKRYDRQLRIWGGHGQAALESARVCLFSAGAFHEHRSDYVLGTLNITLKLL